MSRLNSQATPAPQAQAAAPSRPPPAPDRRRKNKPCKSRLSVGPRKCSGPTSVRWMTGLALQPELRLGRLQNQKKRKLDHVQRTGPTGQPDGQTAEHQQDEGGDGKPPATAGRNLRGGRRGGRHGQGQGQRQDGS